MMTVLEAAGLPIRILDPQVPGGEAPPAVDRFLKLPNGLEIACQSQMEAEHIYEDLFDKRIYLRHGITLWDGMTVFDVGGNIGLFTVLVHQLVRGARTFTFEPAPPLFEILRYNAGCYGGEGRLYHCGLSDRPGRAELTFYPYSSGMSSFQADVEEEKDVLRSIMEHQTQEGMEGMDRIMEMSEELLDARFTSETFECPLTTISAVARVEEVEVIDLLKVDVQKSELPVLRGMESEDWAKVRQVVMEVHDLNGELAEVRKLLDEHGFRVVVEQDPLLDGSVLYNLFAVRRDLFTGSDPAAASPRRVRQGQHRAALQKSVLVRRAPGGGRRRRKDS